MAPRFRLQMESAKGLTLRGQGMASNAAGDVEHRARLSLGQSHQRIYQAMQSLAQKSQPIDMLTVVEELRFREELEMTGGPYYITRLTNSVVSAANSDAHARIILQKFIQRELIRRGPRPRQVRVNGARD